MFELIDAETDCVLVPSLEVASAFSARSARGFLGCEAIDPSAGLLLSDPLRCIHTVGMRFAIDVVFLDRSLRVVRVDGDVRPWRILACRHGHHQLELAAGVAARLGLVPGRRLALRARGRDQWGHAGPESPHAGSANGDSRHIPHRRRCVPASLLPSVPPPDGAGVGTTTQSARRTPCARIC
jgi:uncharacterized membrane protein (UPF0127 family)